MLKPVVENLDAFDPPVDINNAADFAEQGWNFRKGTVAQRAALPAGETFEGLVWRDTDGTGGIYERRSSAWTPVAPLKTEGKRRSPVAGTNLFQDKLSYTDFPNGSDATALAGTFTKVFATTKLIAHMEFSAQLDAGTAQKVYGGLNINGIDYEVAFLRYTSTTRFAVSGTVIITGVAAGTNLAVKPRIRTATAAILNFFSPDDYVSWTLTESV